MPSRERAEQRRNVFRLSEIAAVLSSMIAVVATFVDLRSPLVLTGLSTAIAVSLLLVVAARRLYRTRTLPVTIALGGPSGAGKTAYVSVLMNELMKGEGGEVFFVPEAQTAQYVYQVMAKLRRGTWPPPTSVENISRYRGKLTLPRSLPRLLINGRVQFDVEVADAAGENWTGVAAEYESSLPPRLIESTFFRYVGEDSNVLFYFVGSDILLSGPRAVVEQADDLLSTIQLLRTIQGGDPSRLLRRPLALIVSKSDILSAEQREMLEVVLRAGDGRISPEGHASSADLSDPEGFPGSMYEMERLVAVLVRQVRSYRGFLVSSVSTVDLKRAELVKGPLKESGVSQPVAWTLNKLWTQGRRSYYD